MNENIINNGYKAVDLYLPSGTLWAACNVGALKPKDYGLYFQWGDTQGYTADQVGTRRGQKKFLHMATSGIQVAMAMLLQSTQL